jgi:hypothetical protein
MFARALIVRLACLAAMMCLTPVLGWAEDDKTPTAPPSDQLDVADLWHLMRGDTKPDAEAAATTDAERRVVLVAPTLSSKPSTGLAFGVATDAAFFLGDRQTTHLSSLTGTMRVSTKKQALGTVRFAAFTNRDQWFFQGDERLWWTSQDTFGLGGDTPAADAEKVNYDLFRFFQTAYRGMKHGLFVGVGLNVSDHTDVRPGTAGSPGWEDASYVTYSQAHGFALDRQTSSGTSVAFLLDTRDNQINPQRGALASASYRTYFDGFLGGDSTWQELALDARTYKALDRSSRHKLAFWFLGDLVTHGTAPYFDLPSTGVQERSARGYAEGRYRGNHMLYGEVEYRGTLTSNGLVGVVAFLNTTTIDNVEAGEKLFESFAPGGGFGLRLQLNKRTHTNLCTDFGWGKDGSRGFYLFIREAF